MTRPLTVVLLGPPVAFARTRVSRSGHLFTPTPQRNTAAALRIEAQAAMRQAGITEPLTGPLRLEVSAECPIAGSWSKRKQAAALTGEVRPTGRPDLSNVVKLIEDALIGIAFRDDALIVEIHCRKVYSEQPKIIATIAPIAPGLAMLRAAE